MDNVRKQIIPHQLIRDWIHIHQFVWLNDFKVEEDGTVFPVKRCTAIGCIRHFWSSNIDTFVKNAVRAPGRTICNHTLW